MEFFLKNKNLILGILIILVFYFINKKIYSSNLLQIQNLRSEEEEFKKRKEIIEKWEEVNSRYEKIKLDFLNEEVFKEIIEKEAQVEGIKILSLRPNKEDIGGFQNLNIEMSITFSLYKNFINFLKKMEEKYIKVGFFIEADPYQEKKMGRVILRAIIPKE